MRRLELRRRRRRIRRTLIEMKDMMVELLKRLLPKKQVL
jgi:hypothetical protein